MEHPIGGAGAKTLAVGKPGVCGSAGKEPMCAALYSEPIPMAHGVILCLQWDFDLAHLIAIRRGGRTSIRLPRGMSGNVPTVPDSTGTRALMLGGTGNSSLAAIWHEGDASARYLGRFAWAYWG